MDSNEEAQLKEIRNQFAANWEVPEFCIDFWDGKTRDYCVVIPVINEGDRIRQFVLRLNNFNIDAIADILIVDGGSSDHSLDSGFLRAKGIRCLVTKTGPGRLSAQLRVAYAFALACKYLGVVTIDGNNKDDPSKIPLIINRLGEGCDFVQASRFIKGGKGVNTPLARLFAIRLIHAPILSVSSGFFWTDTTQGFRGYSNTLLAHQGVSVFRSVFDSYELLIFLSYIAPRLGFKCLEVPTTRVYPQGAVPTKISSLRGKLSLLKCLCAAVCGRYTPTKSNHHRVR